MLNGLFSFLIAEDATVSHCFSSRRSPHPFVRHKSVHSKIAPPSHSIGAIQICGILVKVASNALIAVTPASVSARSMSSFPYATQSRNSLTFRNFSMLVPYDARVPHHCNAFITRVGDHEPGINLHPPPGESPAAFPAGASAISNPGHWRRRIWHWADRRGLLKIDHQSPPPPQPATAAE